MTTSKGGAGWLLRSWGARVSGEVDAPGAVHALGGEEREPHVRQVPGQSVLVERGDDLVSAPAPAAVGGGEDIQVPVVQDQPVDARDRHRHGEPHPRTVSLAGAALADHLDLDLLPRRHRYR